MHILCSSTKHYHFLTEYANICNHDTHNVRSHSSLVQYIYNLCILCWWHAQTANKMNISNAIRWVFVCNTFHKNINIVDGISYDKNIIVANDSIRRTIITLLIMCNNHDRVFIWYVNLIRSSSEQLAICEVCVYVYVCLALNRQIAFVLGVSHLVSSHSKMIK